MNGDCNTSSGTHITLCTRQREAYDPCDNFRVDMDIISLGGNYSHSEVHCDKRPVSQAKPKGHDMNGAGSHSVNVKWKRKFSVKHNAYYWHNGRTSMWKLPTSVNERGGKEMIKKEVSSPTSGADTLSKNKEDAQGRMVHCDSSTGRYPRDETNKVEMFTNQANQWQHIEKEKGLRVRDPNMKGRDLSCATKQHLNASSPIQGYEDDQHKRTAEKSRVKKKTLSLDELRSLKQGKLKEDKDKWQPQQQQKQKQKSYSCSIQHNDLKHSRESTFKPKDANIECLVAGVERLKLTCLEIASSGGLSEDPLASRQRKGREALASSEKRGYLLFDEYESTVLAQLIPPYSGKAFKSPKARYEAGWAYNAQKKRWVKAAIQDVETSKRLMKAENIALKAEVKTMKATLAQVVPGTETAVAADPGLAPNLLVLDTNILLKEMSYIQILVADLKKHSEVDASILIPREVYRELDTLKNKLGATYRVRATVRYLEGLRSTRLKDQRYPLLRVQNDSELYRDNGYHVRPALLRGDDAIQNCCLWFSRIAKRKVTLCSGDRIFRELASANRIRVAEAKDISIEIFCTELVHVVE